MNTEKIIFLDFDGVITNVRSGWRMDVELLKRLGKIIDATDCCIVISSSWRTEDVESTKEFLSDPNQWGCTYTTFPYCDRIIGVTKRLYSSTLNKFSARVHMPRGNEIKQWMEDNNFTGNYVILDDDQDMLEEQLPYFINTHPLDGLDDNDVEKAIEILNK